MNQRWYRVVDALCPKRTGGVFGTERDMGMTAERKGILYVFFAAVLYSIGGLCIKVIPWHSLSINSGRNLVAILVVGGYLLLKGHKPRWNRWIALGAVSVCGTNILFTMANKMTTAANPFRSVYSQMLKPATFLNQ